MRKKIFGTSKRPRLSVYRSNKYSYGQIIDDTVGRTLVSVSLKDVRELHKSKAKNEASFNLGKKLAEEAAKKKIKQVVFDRNGYKYHGRVKKVAEGVREGGLRL